MCMYALYAENWVIHQDVFVVSTMTFAVKFPFLQYLYANNVLSTLCFFFLIIPFNLLFFILLMFHFTQYLFSFTPFVLCFIQFQFWFLLSLFCISLPKFCLPFLVDSSSFSALFLKFYPNSDHYSYIHASSSLKLFKTWYGKVPKVLMSTILYVLPDLYL